MAPKKKETVRTSSKTKQSSTQRYLQFAGAHDDVLVLKNGGVRAILEVSSLNVNLKSEDEQNAILKAYQNFLNALNFPVQLLVRSRKLDIDNYLEDLRRQRKTLTNELLKRQMSEYIEYIRKLVEYTDIMEKKFYVVVPMNPARAEKKSFFSKFWEYIHPADDILAVIARRKEFKDLKKDLDSRVNVVKTALENCSLNATQLSTEKIIGVFYQAYNPQLARTQKLGVFEEMSVEEGGENLLVDDE